jgi:hypothetical protein
MVQQTRKQYKCAYRIHYTSEPLTGGMDGNKKFVLHHKLKSLFIVRREARSRLVHRKSNKNCIQSCQECNVRSKQAQILLAVACLYQKQDRTYFLYISSTVHTIIRRQKILQPLWLHSKLILRPRV